MDDDRGLHDESARRTSTDLGVIDYSSYRAASERETERLEVGIIVRRGKGGKWRN